MGTWAASCGKLHRLAEQARHPHALGGDLGRNLRKRTSEGDAGDGGTAESFSTAHISGQGSGRAIAARSKQLGRKVG